MPDIVVVGGGIIGAACAFELADRGASVTLLEKDELAAGASGRNLGYLDTSKDPVLAPLARRSLERYAEISADPPTPFFLDDEPIGTLAVTIDEDELDDLRGWAASAEAVGVRVERVDDRVRELEPELSPDVLEAYLLHEGHRVDPLALTVCLGALARNAGATIRHHTPARRLVARGDRVTGVLTDDGVLGADAVVLAAGPWSPAIARPLGVALPIAAARGWLVHAAPERPLFRHWIQSGARRLLAGREPATASEPGELCLSMREFAEAGETRDVSPMIQPAPDGSVLTGHLARALVRGRPVRPRRPQDRGGAGVPAGARARRGDGAVDVVRRSARLARRAADARLGARGAVRRDRARFGGRDPGGGQRRAGGRADPRHRAAVRPRAVRPGAVRALVESVGPGRFAPAYRGPRP